MHFIDKMPVTLNLGNQEEGLVTKIEVDCTAWYTQWPAGAVSVSFEPPNRDESFLLAYKRVGNVVSVDVTKAMTHYHGSGRLIFRLVVGDDLEKRTKVIETLVEPSLASPTGAMPDPVASWVADATQKLGEVDHFVDDAQTATDAANAAAVRAENGENERENAEGLRVIAEQGRHDAYELAEAARDGLYDAAESDRDGLFNTSQTERTNAYNLRENQRDDAYAAAELIREGAETARETAEGLREEAEGLREQGETNRGNAYSQAESARDGLYATAESARDGLFEAAEAARDGLYDAAESNRDGLFEAAETTRNAQTGDAIDRANTIAETLEVVAPKWAAVDISASGLAAGAAPTASVTQDVGGTHLTVGIPKGDKGDKGDTGPQGPKGDTGPSAYDAAVAGGYSRGESDFYEDLARLDNAPPETWAEIQARVRDGTIDRYLMAGDQLIVPHATYGDIVFDIADISDADDAAMVPGAAGYFASFPNAKPLTLLTRRVLTSVQFSAPQANYKVLAAIPAGAANITLTSSAVASGAPTQYDLTVPEGGFAINSLLRISSATNLQYYATPTSEVVNVTIAAGTTNNPLVASPAAGAMLSAENHKDRVAYGSNNYAQSAIRQWLNSPLAKGTFWTPQSIYDMPPSWNDTLDGFIKGLDADFLSVIGATSRITGNNTVTDGGGVTPFYTLTDKFFLPSRTEVGLSNEIAGGENAAWPLFTSNAGRIKYLTGLARYWWLRSPNTAIAAGVRYVGSDGMFNTNNAYNTYYATAACVIL